jgi:hypothetical protein
MRVRITQDLHGSIDGIHLGDFLLGAVYDVSTALGCYLLCERWAEPVADSSPAMIVPAGETRSVWTARDHAQVRAAAADTASRRMHGARSDHRKS